MRYGSAYPFLFLLSYFSFSLARNLSSRRYAPCEFYMYYLVVLTQGARLLVHPLRPLFLSPEKEDEKKECRLSRKAWESYRFPCQES